MLPLGAPLGVGCVPEEYSLVAEDVILTEHEDPVAGDHVEDDNPDAEPPKNEKPVGNPEVSEDDFEILLGKKTATFR